jgi:hypothetical protein
MVMQQQIVQALEGTTASLADFFPVDDASLYAGFDLPTY